MNKNSLKATMVIAIALFAFIQLACANKKTEKEETGIVINMTDSMFRTLVFDYTTGAPEWNYAGDKPAIIDFYADWCGPCRAISPIMKELAKEYQDTIVIYKVNVDKEQALAGWMQIQSIPALLFIPMDEMPRLMIGQNDKKTYKEAIDSFLLKKK